MATEVTAVVGACGPERQRYAQELAQRHGAHLVLAQRVALRASAVEEALNQVSQDPCSHHLVVEFPLQSPALHIIGELADAAAPAELTDLVCLVDAAHLLSDLSSTEHLRLASPDDHGSAAVYASRAELVVTQIEYASMVVLVNTEPLRAKELNLLLTLISYLAPKAHIDMADSSGHTAPRRFMGRFTMEQTHAGWVSLLNGDFAPRFQDSAVAGLRYEQMRPFHPGRLSELMNRWMDSMHGGMLLRSAGFCHLATRAHITGHWNQVGTHLAMFPAAFDHQLSEEDEPLAFGQDLALIGLDLKADQLVQELDDAALTDRELVGGPALWATFPDPFPEWSTADH
ncbi:GTP-binding protein [Nesterenkonia haasae]|uniref:GTP-binding protein n=1 Tax=Nesterenkonia haasae TaxID=2587813 RepID=UPI0013914DB8|nr:GTP-binding protein [Nesterenkonia haasae]